MEPDEARTVLGISEGASPDEVRRAYTRLVKQHGPDRDPEVFRRVREAYEVVKASAEAREAIATIAAPAEQRSSTPAADVALSDARRALVERLERNRGTAAISMREHLARFPTDDRVRVALMRELEAEGDRPGAAQAAREGADVGVERAYFLREVVARQPTLVREEEIAALRAAPESTPWAVIALTASARLAEAQETAFDALATASVAGPEAIARARMPWLVAVAAMYEHGAGPLARALMRELDRRLPDDVREGHEDTRALALLLRELGDVAGELDRPLTAAIGTFILHPALGMARIDDAFDRSQRPKENGAVLMARAPALAGLIASRARTRPQTTVAPAPSGPRSPVVRIAIWFVVMMMLGALRTCIASRRAPARPAADVAIPRLAPP